MTLLVLATFLVLVTAFAIAGRVSRDRERRAQLARVQADLLNKAICGASYSVFVEDQPLEPWTPAEREAFGINETDALIARIDEELMTPEERIIAKDRERIAAAAAVPPAILGATITADRIMTTTITADRIMTTPIFTTNEIRRPKAVAAELYSWGQEKPVRVIEEESFIRDRDGVWIQQ